MKKLVINIYGGPGCGKSTTATGVFSLLKLHGVNAEFVSEFAKDLTWEERHKTLKNQNYVSAKQHHRQWRLPDDIEVIITDSPILLGLVYGEDNHVFRTHIRSLFNKFDNVNYILKRVKEYNESGRYQTLEEAKEVDKKVISELSHDFGYIHINGDFNAINTITEDILLVLGKEIEYEICDTRKKCIHYPNDICDYDGECERLKGINSAFCYYKFKKE